MDDAIAAYVDHDETTKDEARRVVALLLALSKGELSAGQQTIGVAKEYEAYLKGDKQ